VCVCVCACVGIPELEVIGNPVMTALAVMAKVCDALARVYVLTRSHTHTPTLSHTHSCAQKESGCDILAVADLMEGKGWKMERQQRPSCIHFSIMPQHTHTADALIADFIEVRGVCVCVCVCVCVLDTWLCTLCGVCVCVMLTPPLSHLPSSACGSPRATRASRARALRQCTAWWRRSPTSRSSRTSSSPFSTRSTPHRPRRRREGEGEKREKER
jgi:hypothetical protein